MAKLNKKLTKQRVDDAFNYWMRGDNLESIATQFSVTTAAVSQWSKRYDWEKKRRRIMEDAQGSLYKRLEKSIEKSTERYLAASLLISQMAYEALQSLYREGNPCSFVDEVNKWANILKSGASVHRTVMPEIDDVIAEKILEQLQRFGLKE